MLQKILFLLTVRRMLLLEVLFLLLLFLFLPRKPPIASSYSSSSCSLEPASGIFSSKGSSSSDELSDSAALQTKEEGACKLARKTVIFVILTILEHSAYASDSWPSCAKELWGNKQTQYAC